MKLTIQYLDGDMNIEDDVDYNEIRSYNERNMNWKYISISPYEMICIDEPIERNIDDVCIY